MQTMRETGMMSARARAAFLVADAERRRAQELIATAAELVSGARPARLPALEAEISGLRRAMESRATIEQAKGIVMATTRCSAEEAFEILRQQSQHQNCKLRDVARDLIEDTCRRP